jgi:hypothetical protein
LPQTQDYKTARRKTQDARRKRKTQNLTQRQHILGFKDSSVSGSGLQAAMQEGIHLGEERGGFGAGGEIGGIAATESLNPDCAVRAAAVVVVHVWIWSCTSRFVVSEWPGSAGCSLRSMPP